VSALYRQVWESYIAGCIIIGLLAAASRPLEPLRRSGGRRARIAASLVTALRGAAGAAAICFGGAVVAAALMIARDSAASLRWPTVGGRVLAANVRSVGHSDFVVSIRYGYRIGDRNYASDRVWTDQLGEGFRTERPESWLGRFRPGTPVVVSYDSTHPERSVLLPGALIGSTVVQVILGCLMIAGGLSVPLLGRWRDRRGPASHARYGAVSGH
jgi:Protein of unknown function (DUF3592)